MSPLGATLFTMLSDALLLDTTQDAGLDSLARVDAALHGVTTGCTSLVPAKPTRDSNAIRQELNGVRRCIDSLANDILAEQRAGHGFLAREMEWQLSVLQAKATALAVELTPNLFD